MDVKILSAVSNFEQDIIPDAILKETECLQINDNQTLPENISLFTNKYLVELSRASWSLYDCKHFYSKENLIQPYLRGCQWSPDGTCCLCIVNNDGMHVTELSQDLYTGNIKKDRPVDILGSTIHIKESGLIYDFCWYPRMNSSLPETCCWLTTRQHAPIQMWDAFDGSLRCSYRGFNAVDELESAISIVFSIDGNEIYAGYRKALRKFCVARPGKISECYNLKSSASCLAVSPNLNILAVGSWNTSIALYNIKEEGLFKSIGKLQNSPHTGGITHMKFLRAKNMLISGGRQDNNLVIWDLRYFKGPYKVLKRRVTTNQKIYFDTSYCERYLVSGGTDGIIQVWDMHKEAEEDYVNYSYPIHNDCCNSVAMHPCRPILATGSGQYHSKDPLLTLDREDTPSCSNTSTENQDCMDVEEQENKMLSNKSVQNTNVSIENSLIFWWIGNETCEEHSTDK